jgi:hypothetical protein
MEESVWLIADVQVSLSFSPCIEASHPKQHRKQHLSPRFLTRRVFKLLLQIIYEIHAQCLQLPDWIDLEITFITPRYISPTSKLYDGGT